ncbi:MAG: hypothetical protein ACK560_02335 [Bacteroidota bacterium]
MNPQKSLHLATWTMPQSKSIDESCTYILIFVNKEMASERLQLD